jgi:HD-GYP domain-containing protein (c-di-GMP phosphodiesterase class II)
MDGSGYPEGLVGNAIPLEARIMAIADVYDALVSKRVYKDSMSFEQADKIMMESMGKHFDIELQKFYLAAKRDIERYYKRA